MSDWRDKLHNIIFEAHTPAGRLFDIGLLLTIVFSLALVSLESVQSIGSQYSLLFNTLEWIITIAFTIEFILRLIVTRRPLKYLFSFYGLVDLLSILPTYLEIFFPGAESFILIRSIRLLRIFRVLKLFYFVREARFLKLALRAAMGKIIVFLLSVLSVATITGGLMYVIEGPENGFTSIPKGVYWAIVTLTTVGYGDIAPQTPLGQMMAALIMILGYGIIAVPTGIVSVELAEAHRKEPTKCCKECSLEGHDLDARFCRGCGASLLGS